jgi:chromosome segregation ATPase
MGLLDRLRPKPDQQLARIENKVEQLAEAVFNLCRDLHAHHSAQAESMERIEQTMSEQYQQLSDALQGNEQKLIDLQNTIAAEGAQITAELERLRGQVAPNLQPAIDRAIQHGQALQAAMAQVASFIPDVEPAPTPEPIPEPAPPTPPEGRRR